MTHQLPGMHVQRTLRDSLRDQGLTPLNPPQPAQPAHLGSDYQLRPDGTSVLTLHLPPGRSGAHLTDWLTSTLQAATRDVQRVHLTGDVLTVHLITPPERLHPIPPHPGVITVLPAEFPDHTTYYVYFRGHYQGCVTLGATHRTHPEPHADPDWLTRVVHEILLTHAPTVQA